MGGTTAEPPAVAAKEIGAADVLLSGGDVNQSFPRRTLPGTPWVAYAGLRREAGVILKAHRGLPQHFMRHAVVHDRSLPSQSPAVLNRSDRQPLATFAKAPPFQPGRHRLFGSRTGVHPIISITHATHRILQLAFLFVRERCARSGVTGAGWKEIFHHQENLRAAGLRSGCPGEERRGGISPRLRGLPRRARHPSVRSRPGAGT